MDRHTLFIGGEWVAPHAGTVADVMAAATGKVLGATATGSAADIDAAVAAARLALAGSWSTMTAGDRADVLDRFASELNARGRETARIVSQENGMPITLSAAVNGMGPAHIIRYYAQLARGLGIEEVRPAFGGGRTLVRREPVGVVAAVTPWNYPQALAAMKLGPALAAGCSVVLKPPLETALDAFVFADAATAAGLPPGVLNIVPGGRETGAYLVGHDGVDKVAFTGSTASGRAIAEQGGRMLRPVTLELGGKSVSLVAVDADIELFARRLLDVSLPNNGQTCHACTRVLAPRSRYREVVESVTETVRRLAVGDPLDKATQVGPLVSRQQRERVLEYIEAGRAGGSRLTAGGGIPTDLDGWYVEPTVFADVDNSSLIAQEEIFGPVLCIVPYADEDEAVAIANDSVYGLGGTVWTTDEDRGIELARRIHSGTVGVNHYALDVAAPFGGVKASGLGRELGPEGLQSYQSLKSIYLGAAATT